MACCGTRVPGATGSSRSLLAVTLAICAVSFVIAPQQWFDWIDLLRRSAGVSPGGAGVIPGPLWLRGALAAVLVLAGGRLEWRWTVPVAAALALPVTWSSGMAVLIALIPLYADRVRLDGLISRTSISK